MNDASNDAAPGVAELPAHVDGIVVPLDDSRLSERALRVAAELATRLDADLTLFGAVATEDEARDRERRLARLAAALHMPRADCSVVVDLDPAGAIHEALKRHPGSLACMASHGRGRSAAILGSVSNEVLARGHDPLVLVGHVYDEERVGRGDVAAVDGSPAAPRIARVASQWASLLDEALTIVVVAEPVPPPVRGGEVRRSFGPADPESYLHGFVETLTRSGAEVEVGGHVEYDPISPQSGILTYLSEHRCSFVVVGSRARTGLARLVFGSVAAGILFGSPVPLLVVPRLDP
jgi:nucleotide-binding universal stress UspA family protein